MHIVYMFGVQKNLAEREQEKLTAKYRKTTASGSHKFEFVIWPAIHIKLGSVSTFPQDTMQTRNQQTRSSENVVNIYFPCPNDISSEKNGITGF